MPFTVQQTIIPPPPPGPPTPWLETVKGLVIVALFAIPVLLIGIGALLVLGISYGVWSAGSKMMRPIRKLFGYPPPPESPPVPRVPVVLFQNEQLRLLITEQEGAAVSWEFEKWFERWSDLEQQGDVPSLYLLQTIPEIAGLHGQLVSDLAREETSGVFLQLIEPLPGQVPAGTTWLVYLEFATLRWERVAETQGYYLLPKAFEPAPEPELFRGVDSSGAEIELRVKIKSGSC